jgi:hypothetical protein
MHAVDIGEPFWDEFDLLGARPGLPCLVLGWTEAPRELQWGEAALLTKVLHQFGGHSCLQAELTGLLIPFARNLARVHHIEEAREVFSAEPPRRVRDRVFDRWYLTAGASGASLWLIWENSD